MVRSPVGDVEIPDVALTHFILGRAPARGDRPALMDGATGRTITYAELLPLVRRVAAGLQARGLVKGDVLAIYSPNLPEYAVAFHAIAMAGGIVTTVNPLYTADELAYQLRDSGARRLITVPALIERAAAAARAAGIEEIIVFGEAEGALPFASLAEDADAPAHVPIDSARDVVALPYSSGTTGLPKGVMLTHRNLIANVLQFDAMQQMGEAEVFLAVLPMFHIYGLEVVQNVGLYVGATIVVMQRFELEQYLTLIQRHRVTFAHVVPPLMLALAKHPLVDRFDLSSLHSLFSGAAPLAANVITACRDRLGVVVRQGYGMTEASPATHCTPGDPARIKPGSVGVCVPGTECRVVDLETSAERGPGEEGELLVRGPQVMLGYLNQPDATARTLSSDGWLRTGDIGYADDDGHFYVVDRAKELIKCKGYQIAPAELEAVLLSHPQVADAAVIPCPDDDAGEVPKGFVVTRGPIAIEEVLAYVAERVAPFKRIRYLEVVDEIPKSPSGKILRRILVARERARTIH